MDRKAVSFLTLGVLLGCLLTATALIPAIRAARVGTGQHKTVLKLGHALAPVPRKAESTTGGSSFVRKVVQRCRPSRGSSASQSV